MKFIQILRELPWNEIWKTIALIKGSAIGRGGLLALTAGIGSLTGFWQYLIVGIARKFEVEVELPDLPIWLEFLTGIFLILLGVWLLIWNVRQSTIREPEPTQHDLALYTKFRALITDRDLDFFRTQSFGNSFRRDRTSNLDTLAEAWVGARNEFNHPIINTYFQTVKRCASTLNSEIALKTYPVDANIDLSTVMRENWNDFGVPQDVYETIRRLDALASEFVGAVDDFERVASSRLFRQAQ